MARPAQGATSRGSTPAGTLASAFANAACFGLMFAEVGMRRHMLPHVARPNRHGYIRRELRALHNEPGEHRFASSEGPRRRAILHIAEHDHNPTGQVGRVLVVVDRAMDNRWQLQLRVCDPGPHAIDVVRGFQGRGRLRRDSGQVARGLVDARQPHRRGFGRRPIWQVVRKGEDLVGPECSVDLGLVGRRSQRVPQGLGLDQ
mmetsp:Transcript_131196/g.379497  ORF Transcript_131196/g.379497 Transcript_131196/m.379497 type:complete len:202 (+) Transcript_131196:165-770(+)